MNMISKENIEWVSKNYLCLSCGTCVAICPQNAISMTEIVSGLLVAKVNDSKCIRCGQCVDICPGIYLKKGLLSPKIDPFKGQIISTFCGQATDEKIVSEGQSGGVTTALLCYLIDERLVNDVLVTQMQDDGSLRTRTVITAEKYEIYRAQGSKYCPTAANAVIPKGYITSGRKIAVVGLPCHIHGIRNMQMHYVGKQNDKLIAVGLICEHILSYRAIDYLIKLAGVNRDNIKYFKFRSKQWRGWPGDIYFQTFDGIHKYVPKSYRLMIKNLFTPIRCRLCFDKMNILSDLVMGDAWGVREDKYGHSIIIARTDRGKDILLSAQKAGVIKIVPVDPELILKRQAVEKKRLNWTAYMEAYKKSGGRVPNFNINKCWYADISDINLSPYRRWLEWYSKIENKHFTSSILAAVKRKLFLQKIRMPQDLSKSLIVIFVTFIQFLKLLKKYSVGKELFKNSIIITGGGFINKGAEAMVLTTAHAIKKRFKNVKIFIPVESQSSIKARENGLIPVKKDNIKSKLGRLFNKIRSAYLYLKCKTFIDVGGYQFGDPWGEKLAERKAIMVKRCNRLGNQVFFMPQAWGPFSSPGIINTVRSIIETATLSYVRDKTSMSEVKKIMGKDTSKVRFAHDIAWNFQGAELDLGRKLINDIGLTANKNKLIICVTPNLRVYERFEGIGHKNKYMQFLKKIVEHLCLKFSAEVILLGHELRQNNSIINDDRILCNYLLSMLESSLPVGHLNKVLRATEIKAVIGNCNLLVTSRYHALIAALSQGIPAATIGWSHKYDELLTEVGLSSNIIDISKTAEEVLHQINWIIENLDDMKKIIMTKISKIKKSSDNALEEVLSIIENNISR